MREMVKELIRGVVIVMLMLGIIKVCGVGIEWILASSIRLGMFFGIASMIIVKLLLKMVSE